MTALVVIEAVALLLLTMLVVGLLRSHADILRALEELGAGRDGGVRTRRPRTASQPPGDASQRTSGVAIARGASPVRGQSIDGESVAIAFGDAGQSTVLAFLSATCGTCMTFWEELVRPGAAAEVGRLVVVVQGGDNLGRVRGLAGEELMVVVSDDAWRDYDVPGSPHFVLIDGRTGTIAGEGTGSSWRQVSGLLEQASGTPAPLGAPGGSVRDNAVRIDAELAAAGIGSGHPSLYPSVDSTAESAAG